LKPSDPLLAASHVAMPDLTSWGRRCLQVLLNNTTDLDTLEAKDASGRTALAHCLKVDTLDSLRAAYMLLRSGASPEDCTDELTGETVLLRAIRHGVHPLGVWVAFGCI
jgi:ankyrin repeat protein